MKFVSLQFRPVLIWGVFIIVLLVGAGAFLQFFSLSSVMVEPEDKRVGIIIESWKAIGQFAAAIVVGFGLYWTARNVKVAEVNAETARENAEIARKNSEITESTAAENLKISQGNLEATRDGKLAERYSKAIELLGKKNNEEIDTVSFVGGVYALERIARESPKDHWAVMELMLTLARQQIEPLRGEPISTRSVSTEARALITALGRRRLENDGFSEGHSEHELKERVINFSSLLIQGVSFRSLCFPKALFINTEFHNCDFRGAQLQEVNFQRAKFYNCFFGDLSQTETTDCTGADFLSAKFEDCRLTNTNFTNGVFVGCEFGPRRPSNMPINVNDAYSVDMTGVNFSSAKLAGAYFVPGAELINVNFEGAELRNTELRGVDLSRTINLTDEQKALAWISGPVRNSV